MNTNQTNRGRWTIPTPKTPLRDAFNFLKRTDAWIRIGMCALTITILYVVMFGWSPAFPYRTRTTPGRDLHARTAFEYPDAQLTLEKKERARATVLNYYVNSPQPLVDLRSGLIDDIFEVKQKTFNELKEFWAPRFLGADETLLEKAEDEFDLFKSSLEKDEKLETLREAIDKAFINIDKNGLLETLVHKYTDGNMQEIQVYMGGNIEAAQRVSISDVRIAVVGDILLKKLKEEIRRYEDVFPENNNLAERIFVWFKPRLPATLKWEQQVTKDERRRVASQIDVVMKQYELGDSLEKLKNRNSDDTGIGAFDTLDTDDIHLLRAEHQAMIDQADIGTRLLRSVVFFGFFSAVFAIVCAYLYYRDFKILDELKHFATILGLILITLVSCWLVSYHEDWRAEVIPMMILAMTLAVAYHIELSIFISAIVALLFTVAHGFGVSELVILTTATTAAALLCRTIRSRTKLVYIGFIVGAIVFPMVIGVQYLLGQPITKGLGIDSVWYAGSAVMAGLFMTALLPFLEQWFDIQTDINLLELSDANHPLLKELVQRAPGTYNHSINVASISEAAAESIGANGLLCRVGAYFHDIGKLRKPEYFIENQGGGENKHDDLNPTMSTLVITNHVKEGSEIARTHRLPQRIVDLIEQHHGTTLVEYYYRRAADQKEQAGDSTEVEEKDYRYPGPKPQSREAAVMMMADAVESASRALREPTPARIESLVGEIVKKKLDDGQFDECEITLLELRKIEENLVKSLNAMYHARVKYPNQESA